MVIRLSRQHWVSGKSVWQRIRKRNDSQNLPKGRSAVMDSWSVRRKAVLFIRKKGRCRSWGGKQEREKSRGPQLESPHSPKGHRTKAH